MVPGERYVLGLVTKSRTRDLHAMTFGDPSAAWAAAADVSAETHIRYLDAPVRRVLSLVPSKYDDMWTGAKGFYKVEPIVADGGQVVLYGPHIRDISATHAAIEQIGYHCRDYFLKQWDQFKDVPWGVLAHSTHVRGIGVFENGIENCRAKVTLATGIPPETCRKINLGYRDPKSIQPEQFANREGEGVLLVPKAGEMLYHLEHQPKWAGGNGR